ncbi:hypothetical protein [Streptomyces sp. NPDC051636]|uniref:hypothetical protein n=1 Tax=Streptomyces sp. NPDC051636 TaxID=3365663 RepID=UPI0037BCE1EB
MTGEDSAPRHPAGDAPGPRILCDTGALTEPGDGSAGALWRLAEPGRQLDANIVRLPPARRVDTHTEPDLDVLLLVVAGAGTLISPDGPQPLAEGSMAWLPHGSSRGLMAGADGMSYLTVHRRRPGMRIQSAGIGTRHVSPAPPR